MDGLLIVAIVELTLLSLFGVFLKSKIQIILVLLIGVAISWYIGILRVETFNDIAAREFGNGLRENFPSDGASSVFSHYLGWVPGLIYSGLVFGVGKVLQQLLLKSKQNENT